MKPETEDDKKEHLIPDYPYPTGGLHWDYTDEEVTTREALAEAYQNGVKFGYHAGLDLCRMEEQRKTLATSEDSIMGAKMDALRQLVQKVLNKDIAEA